MAHPVDSHSGRIVPTITTAPAQSSTQKAKATKTYDNRLFEMAAHMLDKMLKGQGSREGAYLNESRISSIGVPFTIE